MKSNKIVLFFNEKYSSEKSIYSLLYLRVNKILDRVLNQRKEIH